MIQKVQSSMMSQTRTQQIVTPLTGTTVQMEAIHHDGTLMINPAGTIAALTVNLPADADADIGEKREVISTQTVTNFTLAGASLIVGAPSSLNPMSSFIVEKILSNTWTVTPQS